MNPLIHPCTFDENRIAFALVGGPIDPVHIYGEYACVNYRSI